MVYAGEYYSDWDEETERLSLSSLILDGMKKYKIKKVMVTIIQMWRAGLITKEAMEKYCMGEREIKDSVNDDLETFFEDLRLGKQPDEEVDVYFLPKLTKEEMKLIKRKDTTYLQTFEWWMWNPDVSEAEMKLSESDSKFVEGWAWRRTFTIENSSENFSDNSSVTSSDDSYEDLSSQNICNYCSLQ